MKNQKKAIKPTEQQVRALRTRKTSFGVEFTRRKAITQTRQGEKVRAPGKLVVVSVRRFGSEKEAKIHAKRFARLEKHREFRVVLLKLRPNAWVNFKTGKTNPVIGRGRTNRR